MIKYYYVDENKDRQGPYSIDELMRFSIDENTLVYCKGMTTWTKAGMVEELKCLFSSVDDSNEHSVIDSTTSSPVDKTFGQHDNEVDEAIEIDKKLQNTAINTNTYNIEDNSVYDEDDEFTFWQKYKIIITVAALLLAIICMFLFKGCHSNSENGNDTLALDTAFADTVETDDQIIVNFITDMFNNGKFNDYDFLREHCTSHLLNKLEADYDYDHTDVAYATWDFRTTAQDAKTGGNDPTKIISVNADGDGWYTYEFYDMGWRGKNRIKAFVKDNIVMMDVVERLSDEGEEAMTNEEHKDWTLTGYITRDDVNYPIMITFHQEGDELTNCIYKNIKFGGKLAMDASQTSNGFRFSGYDNGDEFVIEVSSDYQGNWDGTATIGNDCLTTHLEE